MLGILEALEPSQPGSQPMEVLREAVEDNDIEKALQNQ